MKTLHRFFQSIYAAPAILGLVCLVAYAPLIPWLGIYWDEWPLLWIGTQLGADGLARYFSLSRPFWGWLWQISLSGGIVSPVFWQIYGLFWRWATGLLFYLILRSILPGKKQLPLWAAILFCIYPGFRQQPLGMMYGNFFVVFSAFLLSFWFSVKSLQNRRLKWLFLGGGLLLAAYNLLAMEYFFLLELCRPILLFLTQNSGENKKSRLKRTIQYWLPFLLLFILCALYRAFFLQSYQTSTYRPLAMEAIRSDFLGGVISLLGHIIQDICRTSLEVWILPFQLPDARVLGARSLPVFAAICVGSAILIFILLSLFSPDQMEDRKKQFRETLPTMGFALIILLLAGWPFWLTRLPVTFDFPNDRFTLPFIPGAVIAGAAILTAIPLPQRVKTGFLALVVGVSCGFHFSNAAAYRQDWNQARQMFWQLYWRAPHIKPGTVVFSNDLPFRYYSDNSLTAPLNWVYSPQNHTAQMDFMLYYASIRSERATPLEKDRPVFQNYLAASFEGDTNNVLSIQFSPPGCLRVLDGELEPENKMIPVEMRSAARLSRPERIELSPETSESLQPEALFGPQPSQGWCYFYEKAALAAQFKNWEEVARLYEEAIKINDYSNDPAERIPFIQGYAHTQNWEKAAELTRQSAGISPLTWPVFCRLWDSFEKETPDSTEKRDIIQKIWAEMECP